MRFCPNCHTSYADDTLSYCLQDGTGLIDKISSEEPPTVAFGGIVGSGDAEEITREFSGVPLTERFTPPNDVSRIVIEPQSNPSVDWMQRSAPFVGGAQASGSGSSNMLVAVLATVLVMLLLFGVAGIVAWLYFSANNTADARLDNSNTAGSNVSANDPVAAATASPLATPTATTQRNTRPESTPTASPPESFDSNLVRNEVSEVVLAWKSLAELRDLSTYMSYYANTIDYYNKSGAAKSFVRGDKQKAFAKYDEIRIAIGGISVTADASGRNATADFDKQWYFGNISQSSEGKVRTQLKLVRTAGGWKITGERDLKVYYVK